MFCRMRENGLRFSVSDLGGQGKESLGIGSRLFRHLGGGYAMQFSQLGIHILNAGGFVAFPAVWMWREEGGIGLDQESVARQGFDQRAEVIRLFEGDGPGKSKIKTQRKGAFSDGGRC